MTKAPRVLFDPAKDAANIKKHGVSLALAGVVIEGAATTFWTIAMTMARIGL